MEAKAGEDAVCAAAADRLMDPEEIEFRVDSGVRRRRGAEAEGVLRRPLRAIVPFEAPGVAAREHEEPPVAEVCCLPSRSGWPPPTRCASSPVHRGRTRRSRRRRQRRRTTAWSRSPVPSAFIASDHRSRRRRRVRLLPDVIPQVDHTPRFRSDRLGASLAGHGASSAPGDDDHRNQTRPHLNSTACPDWGPSPLQV